MATQTERETYVTINPNSFYHNAVVRKNWCNSDTWLVVGFTAWSKWYNEQRFKNTEVTVPYPACTADTYEIARKLCDDLNN